MKTVEELGLTPLPWRFTGYHFKSNGKYVHLGEVSSISGFKLAQDLKQPDARVFANAPAMYEQLRQSNNLIEHVIQFLYKFPDMQKGLREIAKKNRALLAKVSDEEVPVCS